MIASNDQKFRFDYQNGEYGYVTESGGADTFTPFKKALDYNKSASLNMAQGNSSTLTASDDCQAIVFVYNRSGGNFTITLTIKLYVNNSVVATWSISSTNAGSIMTYRKYSVKKGDNVYFNVSGLSSVYGEGVLLVLA